MGRLDRLDRLDRLEGISTKLNMIRSFINPSDY
jgi:hypothetical protein